MFDEKFMEVVGKEGVVAIVSCAEGEAHVVNTWNSYLLFPDEQRILIPAWKMLKTEKNINQNAKVLLTLGTKEVEGRMGPGTGYLIKGTAKFIRTGDEFNMMKSKFGFLTRVLEATVSSVKQTL